MRRVMIFLSMIYQFSLASITIEDTPFFSIAGPKSGLNRPEGIAFLPDNNLVAVANANKGMISFYSLDNDTPLFTLKGKKFRLGYPHDIAISKSGFHLAVASFGSNTITFHKQNPEGFYEKDPCQIVFGKQVGLKEISSIDFHPRGDLLAVGDVKGHCIALFQWNEEMCEASLHQILRTPLLDRPDGLAFSKDGHLLAVTSHGNHTVLIYEFNRDGFYSEQPMQILQSDLCFPHSLCFHPVDDTLVVSSAGGRKTMAVFEKISDQAPYYCEKPFQVFEIFNPDTIHFQKEYPEEGGVKGVAFSSDGKILGICASDIDDPSQSILFFNSYPTRSKT